MAASDSLDTRPKVWTTLITNTTYLTGLLTLEHSLRRVGSKYPLVALYTDTFEEDGHRALDARGIAKRKIKYLLPTSSKDYSNDVRFYDCWSKLQPFGLFEYSRVVQLDSDMVVLRNMDELMDIPLDPETRVFAAAHACVCNPYEKPHYPRDWTAANCVYTHNQRFCTEYKAKVLAGLVEDAGDKPASTVPVDLDSFGHSSSSSSSSSDSEDGCRSETSALSANTTATSPAVPDQESFLHAYGPGPDRGLGICNGGLQVVAPHRATYERILAALSQPSITSSYDFADQSLLSDVFAGRWVPLSYKYNALKTLRTVHADTWDDSEVANIHYIVNPKPWDVRHLPDREDPRHDDTGTFRHWFLVDDDRIAQETEQGILDGF